MNNKIKILATVGFGLAIGYLKGYDTGMKKGIKTGQVQELVNQGYSYEDAKRIVEKGRIRMITTTREMFADN